jgi:hypothetical protein
MGQLHKTGFKESTVQAATATVATQLPLHRLLSVMAAYTMLRSSRRSG